MLLLAEPKLVTGDRHQHGMSPDAIALVALSGVHFLVIISIMVQTGSAREPEPDTLRFWAAPAYGHCSRCNRPKAVDWERDCRRHTRKLQLSITSRAIKQQEVVFSKVFRRHGPRQQGKSPGKGPCSHQTFLCCLQAVQRVHIIQA